MTKPKTKFKTILADPAFDFKARSAKGDGRSAKRHYTVTSLADMMALPVAEVADKDAMLLMWVSPPFLEQALKLMKAWGFTYKTVAFEWIKLENGRPFFGMGYWTRSNMEFVLLGTRGKPKRLGRDVEALIFAEMGDHSAKPYEQYRRIERLTEGPYLELFAQLRVPKWGAWGNRVGARGGQGGFVVNLPKYPASEVFPAQLEFPIFEPKPATGATANEPKNRKRAAAKHRGGKGTTRNHLPKK